MTAAERLAEIEEKRRARREALAAQAEEQKVADLEAVNELEERYGDNAVTIIHVPPTPGHPTLVAARAPNKAEVKRYRDRCAPKPNGKPGDAAAAAEELAAVCLAYPSKEIFAEMLEARPGLQLQLGVAAANLATGREADEGKG